MCGVVGYFAYAASAGAVDRDEMRAVRDAMALRGPDGSGEWFAPDARVALGHRRLAIIDLSPRGAQPMASANGLQVISFNGEIYNYRELRDQLRKLGRVFASDSDTEVLLQLYDEYGTGMLSQLRGMFAFALWDGQRQRMLLARDAFGIKPLYYADDGRMLRAASSVKALLHADVDKRPEPAGHAGFYLWGSVPAPWTLYRGIRALEAGHFMWVGESGAQRPECYCDIPGVLAAALAQPARGDEAQAIDAVAQALRDSVRAHLVADVPVGVFLSAGLDSTMLASVAATCGATPRTLTLAFAEYEGTPDDEAPLARSVAQHIGTQHSTVTVRRTDFEAERGRLLAGMDQPSIDGVNSWFVARAAASRGIKVALSGLGGDELFGTYPSFSQVPLLAHLAKPFSRVPRLGLCVRTLSEPLVRRFTSPKYAGLLEYGGSLGGAYLLRRGLFMPWELPRLMDPDMAREGWDKLQTMARLETSVASLASRPRMAVSALEMSWYMRHQLLCDADWAGMAHSVEIRTPFVDVPFLKAAAPWIAAHPSAVTKSNVARAAANLPDYLFARPKTGFQVPVREWLGATSPSKRGLRTWSRRVHDEYPPAPGGKRRPRVLVSTLTPGAGGVMAMTRFAVRNLESMGMEPVIAHYLPYSVAPQLSVPSYRLLQRGIGTRRSTAFGEHESIGIGAWLPELEFTHYLATRPWRDLMDSCDAFVAVSGNVLAATAFVNTRRKCLAWVATDWDGDRAERVRHFPLVRRLLDTLVNAPVIRRMERRLLRAASVISLSEYTQRTLSQRAEAQLAATILPVPVDFEDFALRAGREIPGLLGFTGRFNDPRKNIELLLQSAALLRNEGHDVSLLLIGDTPTAAVQQLVAKLGLAQHVEFAGGLSREAMLERLQTLDVFVLPSHQEGLCISALEAMACAIPVVSTRCGGPEEFVLPGSTGALCDDDPQDMARSIASVFGNRAHRDALGRAARALVQERYARERADAVFQRAFEATFPGLRTHGASMQSHEAVPTPAKAAPARP